VSTRVQAARELDRERQPVELAAQADDDREEPSVSADDASTARPHQEQLHVLGRGDLSLTNRRKREGRHGEHLWEGETSRGSVRRSLILRA
jgi:hypothetical protein